MKTNFSGWYLGRFSIYDKVIDIPRFQIRPKIKQSELEIYYKETLKEIVNHRDFFEQKEAFNQILEELKDLSKAELRVLEPNYPPPFRYETESLEEQILHPKESLRNHKYFTRGRIYAQEFPSEGTLAVIEVPSDRTRQETKKTVTHLTLSYLVEIYEEKIKNNFNLITLEEEIEYRQASEGFVDCLTNLVLKSS